MKILKIIIVALWLVLGFNYNYAQVKGSKVYRAEKEKIHDLVHTKLKVSFDFSKRYLYGEEWVTLKPHFYTTNKLSLDAKGMLIHAVSLHGKNLEFNYDGAKLTIDLDKDYVKDETFTLYIKYTARPEKVTQKGSVAISSAKGLYFIDPDETDPDKPTQIWTQGETESSSCWFPTIDAPNQKTSQELLITVPEKYVTLSNGLLVDQIANNNGTRTDHWEMKQRHAPYLFFMGVGEFSVVKDSWKGKVVDYYVEKEYEPFAREIFGKTPKMMQFFSDLTGIEYPWDKYSQMVGRDYVSGAMENTTAVLHGEGAYQNNGQLIDQNTWETTIAHELFHHWFGNLVTTESWSNLTLNESFANYSEYLWLEREYGKDRADAHLHKVIGSYLLNENYDKNLVRFQYANREDMFDAVSYNKGGAILHMLRNYLGDEAFFAGLNKYLTTYQYASAEAHQLRLALESVTGKDLNWFFNQWYYGSGHPKIKVTYDYNIIEKTVAVNIIQGEKVFNFPLLIDVYEKGRKLSSKVFIDAKEKSYIFPYENFPDLINVNADHVLLAEISDKKTLENYIFQYNNAPHYLDRREAILVIAKHQQEKDAFRTMQKALNDKYYELRILALQNIDLSNKFQKKEAVDIIEKLATNDPKTLVQAAAIEVLGKLVNPEYKPLFLKALDSKSYSVLGNALVSMYYLDKNIALEKAGDLPDIAKKSIAYPLVRMYIEDQDKTQLPFIANYVIQGMFLIQDKEAKALYEKAFDWVIASDDKQAIKNLTKDLVKKGKQYKQYGFHVMAINLMRQMVKMQEKEGHQNQKELIDIIKMGMTELVD